MSTSSTAIFLVISLSRHRVPPLTSGIPEHLSSLESTLGAKDPQKQLAQEEASRLCKEVVDRECSVASGRYAHAAIVAHPGLSEAAASRIQPALRSTRGIGREVILVSGGTVAGAEKNGTHPDAETDLRPTVSERSGRSASGYLRNVYHECSASHVS
jgi:hypothetical protein